MHYFFFYYLLVYEDISVAACALSPTVPLVCPQLCVVSDEIHHDP